MLLKCGPGKHGANDLFAERGEKRMGQKRAKFGPRLGQKQKWARSSRSNPLICLARPTRFERVTPAFGGPETQSYRVLRSPANSNNRLILFVLLSIVIHVCPA